MGSCLINIDCYLFLFSNPKPASDLIVIFPQYKYCPQCLVMQGCNCFCIQLGSLHKRSASFPPWGANLSKNPSIARSDLSNWVLSLDSESEGALGSFWQLEMGKARDKAVSIFDFKTNRWYKVVKWCLRIFNSCRIRKLETWRLKW